jgi:purine-cytosine permease-like protein
MLGYGMIDCLVGGQILSAVADGKLTVIVGIIIIAVISWVIVVFGMSVFQTYQRYACIYSLSIIVLRLRD